MDQLTTDWLPFDSASEVSGSDGAQWSNVQDFLSEDPTSDRAFAEGLESSGGLTRMVHLVGVTLPANIPANAILVGIEVRLQRRASAFDAVSDASRQLILDGLAQGDNLSSSSYYTTSWTTAVTGGASNLWGSGLKTEDIGPQLGFGFRAINSDTKNERTVFAADAAIRFTFDIPPTQTFESEASLSGVGSVTATAELKQGTAAHFDDAVFDRLVFRAGEATELTANALSAGAHTLGSPGLDLTSKLSANSLSAEAPAYGPPGLDLTSKLSTNSLSAEAHALGSPGLDITSKLSANALGAETHALGTPVARPVYGLAPAGVTAGPVDTTAGPSIFQATPLLAEGLDAGTSAFGLPRIEQTHNLLADLLGAGGVDLGQAEAKVTSLLGEPSLIVARPALGQPSAMTVAQLAALDPAFALELPVVNLLTGALALRRFAFPDQSDNGGRLNTSARAGTVTPSERTGTLDLSERTGALDPPMRSGVLAASTRSGTLAPSIRTGTIRRG